MSKPTLAYWNIRGLAQPIRCMLVYSGVEFEEKFYQVGPNNDRRSWYNVKPNLGLHFPNLPYFIDGDIKISQTQAIISHIARKHGLDGKTEEEKIYIDMVNGVFMDVDGHFIMCCYDMEGKKDGFMKTLPEKLKAFSDFLGSREWFAGDEITFIDFKMHELLKVLSKFAEGCLDEFENLKTFLANFETLPAIAKFMKSPDYIEKPFNNPNAQWTGGE